MKRLLAIIAVTVLLTIWTLGIFAYGIYDGYDRGHAAGSANGYSDALGDVYSGCVRGAVIFRDADGTSYHCARQLSL